MAQKEGQGDPAVIDLYRSEATIHARSVNGIFSRWRWLMVWLTQLLFYGLPWFDWGQRQAVLFDLGSRRFYIFGLVLYPQDFIYLTGLLVVCALSLFLFTAVAGRLWCGYTCPQTVYTEIFVWIEEKIEGNRAARIRLDAAKWGLEKIGRKGSKHLLWAALALWTGFTFVGYFTPIRELGTQFLAWNLGNWETFWIFFYGFATYGNAGWMREQVCKYMCPYARFQSAMLDKDTLIVAYDNARGEPRGKRKPSATAAGPALGDCIDCGLCVQVCPTGIDIRKGLQYECIGCAACIDACDSVMDKLGAPRGLVRYSTQNAMNNPATHPTIPIVAASSGTGSTSNSACASTACASASTQPTWSLAETLRHVLRPRVLVYTAILWAIIISMGVSLYQRSTFRVDIVRDRGSLGRLEGENIENVYSLQFMNASETSQTYILTARSPDDKLPGLAIASKTRVSVGPAQSEWVPVRLQVPAENATQTGAHDVVIDIQLENTDEVLAEKTTFIVPR